MDKKWGLLHTIVNHPRHGYHHVLPNGFETMKDYGKWLMDVHYGSQFA